MATPTVTLYRPCNHAEYDRVERSGFRRWPPRLATQPIFYPVTNLAYARRVNAWNVTEHGQGHILRFEVRADFMERYPVQTVGDTECSEWWIPAEDLEAMNDAIVGYIELVESEPPA
jgi:hypothetical protein